MKKHKPFGKKLKPGNILPVALLAIIGVLVGAQPTYAEGEFCISSMFEVDANEYKYNSAPFVFELENAGGFKTQIFTPEPGECKERTVKHGTYDVDVVVPQGYEILTGRGTRTASGGAGAGSGFVFDPSSNSWTFDIQNHYMQREYISVLRQAQKYRKAHGYSTAKILASGVPVQPENTKKFTYHSNDGTGSSFVRYAEFNTHYDCPEPITRDGYTFAFWSATEDGWSGEHWVCQQHIVVGPEDIDMYAIWKSQIIFNYNGLPIEDRVETGIISQGNSILYDLPPENYEFLCWSSERNDPNCEHRVDNNGEYFIFPQESSTTYYMQYRERI